MDQTDEKPVGVVGEIGNSGLRIQSGMLKEEFLKNLQGERGRRVYREMSENDPIIGAALTVLRLIISSATYKCEMPEDLEDGEKAQAEEICEFYDTVFNDMSHTWTDFITEALSMMTFGWAWHEVVLKKRDAVDHPDARRRSAYPDGLYGIRKLAPRAQESLVRWHMQEDGGIEAMEQRDPNTGKTYTIPIARSVLFRTMSRKNSPEGVSLLRACYRPWFFHNRIQECEAIGVERELAGLPVIYVPNDILTKNDAANIARRDTYFKLVRDLRLNNQAGAVLPSTPYFDAEGKPTSIQQVKLELLASAGTRTIDTQPLKRGYQADILRNFLAEFLLLGVEGKGGSYSLSNNKTDMFLQACYAVINQIYEPINRHVIPRLGRMNGFPRHLLPTIASERFAPVDLDRLGAFVADIAGAGAPLFPDDRLENHLRAEADLPERDEDAIAQRAEAAGDTGDIEGFLSHARQLYQQMGAAPTAPGAGNPAAPPEDE